MIITNTSFAINFEPLDDCRKKFMLNADILKPCFSEPTFLPIPDNVPDEIPRVTCQTTHGHSELVFTKSSLHFNTAYDNVYQYDWDKCKIYLQSKINLLMDLLYRMECKLFFSGLNCQVLFESQSNDGTKDLVDKFSTVSTKSPIFDFGQKIVLVFDKTYFINYSINNIRLYDSNNYKSGLRPGFLSKQDKNEIGVVIDINDRYDFNYNTDFSSNPQKIRKILDLADNCIGNLNQFIDCMELKI